MNPRGSSLVAGGEGGGTIGAGAAGVGAGAAATCSGGRIAANREGGGAAGCSKLRLALFSAPSRASSASKSSTMWRGFMWVTCRLVRALCTQLVSNYKHVRGRIQPAKKALTRLQKRTYETILLGVPRPKAACVKQNQQQDCEYCTRQETAHQSGQRLVRRAQERADLRCPNGAGDDLPVLYVRHGRVQHHEERGTFDLLPAL